MNIKEEDPLCHIVASQNKRELLTKGVTMKTSIGGMLLDDDCDVAVKTEIKSETPFTDFFSQKERECFIKHPVKPIKSETVISINNCEINTKKETEEKTLVSEFGSVNERENPLMKDKECNISDDMNDIIEIKEEHWWLDPENLPVCNNSKDADITPVTFSRVCRAGDSGDSDGESPLPPLELSGRNKSPCIRKDHPECENQKSDVTETPATEKHVYSEQYDACIDGETDTRGLHSKQKTLIYEGKKPHRCTTCNKCFTHSSSLKTHKLIHEGKKPHQCRTCGKHFTQNSSLKRHNLIHEGKKPHQCKICNKRFARLSDLKIHNVIHNGEKPHHCNICGMNFTQRSSLIRHNVVHAGKKLLSQQVSEYNISN